MSFLVFLGIAASFAYGLSNIASDVKTASCKQELNKEPYNLDQFETVLRLCRVKRHKYDGFPILDSNCDACLDYIRRQPLTDENDVKAFINKFNSVRNAEIQEFLCYWEDIYNETYEKEIKNTTCSDVVIFQKDHYLTTYDAVNDHTQELYDSTFFGEIAVARPKVFKENNKIIEVWALYCGDRVKAEEYYEMCSKVLGKLVV